MQNNFEFNSIDPTELKPVKIQGVEISNPLPAILRLHQDGVSIYDRALIVVRLHDQPLGLLQIDFQAAQIASNELANKVWVELGERINQHLKEDGLPPISTLTADGLPSVSQAKCLVERDALLEQAPLISIILATRDRVQSLAVALDSIAELVYPKLEIILVDSAPRSSETEDFFTVNRARFAAKNICMRYVREQKPGLAVAHNRGLEAARGTIIAFTDDDVQVDRYWLVELLRGFQAAEYVGCVTGLVLPMELETPAQLLFEEFGGFAKGFDRQLYDLDGHHPQNALYPYTAGRFGTGANMAFTADYLHKVGGFDPAMGVGTPTRGGDDMAAFFQVISEGYRLVYQPSAMVMHRHRSTYADLQRQMLGYGSGLTAFLTRCIVEDPLSIFRVAAKVPAGLRYVFSTESTKNGHKSAHYPKELDRIERRGMLIGPFEYVRSRWQYRDQRGRGAKSGQNIQPADIKKTLIEKSDH